MNVENKKSRIAESVKKAYGRFHGSFSEFKVTMAALLLWTAVSALEDVCTSGFFVREFNWSVSYRVTDWVFRFFFLLFISTFFAETCFRGKKLQSYLSCFILTIFSAALSLGVSEPGFIKELFDMAGGSGFWHERFQGFMGGYVIILLALTVYFSFKRSGILFSEYAGRVLSNMVPVMIIYFVLFFGLLFVWAVLITLFSVSSAGILILMLPVTLYLLPGCIYALNHVEREISPEISLIIKYLINIFSICIILIGYGYALSLIIGEMPSNEIFGILTALFCMSAPVWIMNEADRKDTFFSKLAAVLPYIFSPLILLQIYSIAVRIGEYGFTPGRYVGIAVILFELCTILIWAFCRKRCERLLLLLAVFAGISTMVPGINMYSVSFKSQEAFLNECLVKDSDFSDLENKRFQGAYRYLKKRMSEEKFEERYGKVDIQEEEKYRRKWRYLHGCQMAGEIDTVGFAKMNMLNQSDKYPETGSDEIAIDFSKFEFYKRGTGEKIEIDLSDFYTRCMEYKEANPDSDKEADSAYMKQFNKIRIDRDRVFYVNHFQVNYYTVREDGKEVRKITSVNIGGMLLE